MPQSALAFFFHGSKKQRCQGEGGGLNYLHSELFNTSSNYAY